MRNHIEEPTVEQIHPIRILTRDGGCQCTDTVFTVPCGKPVEKIFQRVEYRHAIGVNITTNIPVPQRNTFHLCIQSNAVQRTFVERIEAETERKPFTIFYLTNWVLWRNFISAFMNSSVCKASCCSLLRLIFLPKPLHSVYILPIICRISSSCLYI